MTDPGPISEEDSLQPVPATLKDERSDTREETRIRAADDAARTRFGAAAIVLDRLDTRPLHLRTARRPWWKFWS